ncbi:MAG: helix-turn-helix transcriptional regulator [Pseudomonadota bacterium]
MITNESMDQVFHALAHQTRRTILDLLRENPGWPVGRLAAQFDCSRIAVMNHLGVLETAGLVVSEKDGRSRRLYLNQVPIQMIYERWTDEYAAHWGERVTSIKRAAERAAGDTQERKKD